MIGNKLIFFYEVDLMNNYVVKLLEEGKLLYGIVILVEK